MRFGPIKGSRIEMALALGYFLIEKDLYEHITVERVTIGDSDGFIVEFLKDISEDLIIRDTPIIQFSRGAILDTVLVSDSRMLVQDYADYSYFAEDYVGILRNARRTQFTKIENDNSAIMVSDSGVYRVQDYADPTYFAEDYVDTLRNDRRIQFNKVENDNVAIMVSDSGMYKVQGYADPTYFAEDYVGASGTF